MEQTETKPTTWSIGLKWGLISTAVSIALFLIPALAGMNAFDKMWGYTGGVIGIVLLVLAHRDFKNNGDGYMSYGQGIAITFYSTIVSLVLVTIFSYVYSTIIDPSAMDKFYDAQRAEMEKGNMPEEQMEVALEWTRKLFWVFYIIMGLFFGMLTGLIVSIFTQKRSPQTNF
jgi:hypothetical protein